MDTIKTGMDFPGMVAALVKARCIPSKDAKKTGLRGLARAVANPPKPCSPGDPSVVAAAASLDAVRDVLHIPRRLFSSTLLHLGQLTSFSKT